jgi:hypothetical protein
VVVAYRPKRLSDRFVPPSDSELAPADSPTHQVETEAPERAVEPREAPESRSSRQAEAPDAGEGRGSYYEHEFTHGRSQS